MELSPPRQKGHAPSKRRDFRMSQFRFSVGQKGTGGIKRRGATLERAHGVEAAHVRAMEWIRTALAPSPTSSPHTLMPHTHPPPRRSSPASVIKGWL